jgi:hypothetical protein
MSTIQLKRGSTLELPMQVTKDGAALSLAGKSLTYLVKTRSGDADADSVLAFAIGDGLSLTSASTGHFKLTATAEEMNLSRNYYYGALQIRDDATGDIIELPEDAVSDVWAMTGHLVLSTA